MTPPRSSSSARSPRQETRALRFAWIAARLHGIGYREIPSWAENHGLATASPTSFERAVGPIRATSAFKAARGRSGQRVPKAAPLVRDWLLVDEPGLGVRTFLFRLPNDGMPQPRLLADVRELPGVRQVLEVTSDRELLVIALARDERQGRDLRARLEELAPGRAVRMDRIEREDQQPAARTWLDLARREFSPNEED